MQDSGEVAADKVRTIFEASAVYKSARRSKQFSALSIPSYLRDWIVMRFADGDGQVDMEEVQHFIRETVPRRDDWEALKSRMVKAGQPVRFLAKVQAEIDVRSGECLFSLPDFGFPRRRYEAVIDGRVVRQKGEEILRSSETWGVIELEWRVERIGSAVEEGHVKMVDFRPFRPYSVDLGFYQRARSEFSLDEWIDVLLMGIDYNPAGFRSQGEKLALLSRLLPFVEKRLNLIELAPKGTGKSYVFSQLTKYGWLVSGGSIGRPRLFYNVATRTPGLVSRYDYVALDEVQSITFSDDEEVRGALKGYMESGEYRVGDYRGVGDAGIVLLGNIDVEAMDVERVMFSELPQAFHESALIDRFHGFVKGWSIPRMRENLKAEGWGLNTEYLSEIMHALREDVRYRATVDRILCVPPGADTRDAEAIKRLSAAWLKLLFPCAVAPDKVVPDLFRQYCLEPAKEMRRVIRKQLRAMDPEYSGGDVPAITC